MKKQKYRVEIQSKLNPEKVFTFWIGENLELFGLESRAVACTHEEHLMVMARIDVPATAYGEGV